MAPPLQPHENRLPGADLVRVLACAMVLVHHLCQRLSPQAIDVVYRKFLAVGMMGYFGVAAFFVLSGYLLARPFWLAYDAARPRPSLQVYAMRRAARILPAFWLALTVSFLLSFTLFGFRLDGQLVLRYLAGLFVVSDFHYVTLFPVEFNGPLWSIGFEITSYCLLALLAALMFTLRPRLGPVWGGRLFWLAVVAAAVLVHYAIRTSWPIDDVGRGWGYGNVGGAKEWMPRYNPVGFFAMFALGSLAAGIQVRLSDRRHWLFDVLTLLGLAAAGGTILWYVGVRNMDGFGWLDIPYGYPAFPLGIALALLAAPSCRYLGATLDNPPVRYLAHISFGVYLWHYLLIEIIRQNWYHDLSYQNVTSVEHWLVIDAAVVALAVLIGHLSYYLLEAPVIAWARSLERRAPRSVAATA